MPFDWLLRAVGWVRNPPSAKMVKLVLAVIAVALALGAVERFLGWPDWLTVDNIRRGAFR
ncbi:hypothetical protein roselon_02882 [Roseibacterium elongatum DSM 19469]|uniref:Uncharacterized protein n=1 Tax=Roseicyclus elongatus DSM 19469 TaxID=1294273 RepID=W8S894_9RHOB|nr:hypothetical protein [Roseibacterium elongatum]AHM05176.1 hypothetical protein roselon_02882 [Roseibacterium elongatum DSM 19469]